MSASHPGFRYETRSNGSVDVFREGRLVSTLRGKDADRFLNQAADAPDDRVQQLLARVTGNYKRGNERHARQHPRNR